METRGDLRRLIDLIMPERILKAVPEWRSLKRRPSGPFKAPRAAML